MRDSGLEMLRHIGWHQLVNGPVAHVFQVVQHVVDHAVTQAPEIFPVGWIQGLLGCFVDENFHGKQSISVK
ncbi:MAG: hypothetical protein ACI841_001398 [Planctomycetota bacterium]|jgi:hypothetical protein